MATQQFFPSPDSRKVYAKIRVADNAILSRAAHWPAFPDDTPIIGDDGTIIYLPYLVDDDPQEYDSDLFSVQTSEVISASAFTVTKTLIKRPLSELKTRAANYEALYRSQIISPQELSALAVIGMAIIFKTAKNLNTTPDEDAYVQDIITAANKLTANNARLAEVNDQADKGQTPDLKAGWLKS